MGFLNKVLQRSTDLNYLRHAARYYPRRVVMQRKLARLRRYHAGQSCDFTGARNAALIAIVNYARQCCPFYRERFAAARLPMDRVVEEFGRIPLLDKAQLRQHAPAIASIELPSLIYGTGNTGGSTGEPLEFLTSVNHDTEHQAFLYAMMGYQPGDRILAMDGSAIDDDHLREGVYWRKKSDQDIPYGSMALSSLYLSETTRPSYLEFINSFRPAIIRGYPAFVDEMATYLLENGIKPSRRPKGIVLTSESSNASQIERIENAFDAAVFLQYGHSEASLFAYTIDATYEYYCSPFYGLVEVVNDSGDHVDAGEIGEVVCTGFYNYAMPFIRYRTGDLAVFSGDRDGIIRLATVLGRTQDYVYDSRMRKTLLTALVFGLHYRAFAHIVKWQIVQDVPGAVTIRVVREKRFNGEDEDEIRRNFTRIANVTTNFEYVECIPLTRRGKSLFLVQNIGRGDDGL